MIVNVKMKNDDGDLDGGLNEKLCIYFMLCDTRNNILRRSCFDDEY
jgi:hypothetical protein